MPVMFIQNTLFDCNNQVPVGFANCEQCCKSYKIHPGNRGRFCSSKCRGQWQRVNSKPVTREWLYQKYIVEELDCTQISKIVNRNSKRVWEWLRDFEIPTRHRGSFKEVQFKKGHRSGFSGRKHTIKTRNLLRDIAKADGRVPFDPKVGSYMKGRSGSLHPKWKGGLSPERQEVYGSNEWKSVARKVKVRDKQTCQKCGLKKGEDNAKGIAFDIHHIVSFACVELRCEPENLIYLCEPCHYWVHSSRNVGKEYIRDANN